MKYVFMGIITQYSLTAGELEVAGVPVQRVLHKLHTLAHHSDVTPADGEILLFNK